MNKARSISLTRHVVQVWSGNKSKTINIYIRIKSEIKTEKNQKSVPEFA